MFDINPYCACCNRSLSRSESRYMSSLYGSRHILCSSCWRAEEQAIEDRGTNKIPDLLKRYGVPNDDWREEAKTCCDGSCYDREGKECRFCKELADQAGQNEILENGY